VNLVHLQPQCAHIQFTSFCHLSNRDRNYQVLLQATESLAGPGNKAAQLLYTVLSPLLLFYSVCRRQSDDTSSQDCSGDAQSQSPGHYSLSSDDEFEFPTVRFRKPLKADSLSGGSDVQIVEEPEERVDAEDIILSHVLTQSLREMTQGDTLERCVCVLNFIK